jgi:hypothetical protein
VGHEDDYNVVTKQVILLSASNMNIIIERNSQ